MLRSLDPSLRHDSQIFYGLEKIKNSFSRKKVILVLDDIDDKIHFRGLVGSFGNGSRIIFTTKNAELHEETISSNADFYGLEKKEMDSKQSLKLYSRHAFGGVSPPKEFEVLSIEVISTTGGLPLALEVVGSFLHRRKAKVWRETIKKLKESPHQDVQQKLKLSYDALEYEHQEIFLDIACFFIGVEKRNVVYMWEACGFYPYKGIEVLISMSLIKLNEKKCFWMHDQLRDLGRAIVKVNSTDVRAGSRLWMHKDALDLLKTNGGKESVEALHLDGDCVYLDRENFVGLEKLRFLRMTERTNFDGDFSGLIPKLRWMSLLDTSSFNVTNLYLRELVVLELSWCKFDETWPGWGQILISQQLKVLTLSYCDELISTPDLSKVVNLERLNVNDCGKFTSLHSSIRKLQCLRRLSIRRCTKLQLSNSIGRLVSLTRLELERVVHLPNSIGELVKLKHLSLSYSRHLRVLPDSIGDLKSLIRLDLSDTLITELPTTIGGLAKLESLDLSRCRELQRLPHSIGNLQSLVDLYMSGCQSIAELPHSFGNLSSLQKLNLMGLSIGSLPYSIICLEKLERLDIGVSWGQSWITNLSQLPSRLSCLKVTCVQKIQILSNVFNLSELEIHNNELMQFDNELVQFKGIEKLSKLKRLSIECSNVKSLSMEWIALQQLKSLELRCPSLEFGQCQLPWSLESLSLDVKKWGNLPSNLSSLKNLSKLKLTNFVIEEADSVKGLISLKDLKMVECILFEFTNNLSLLRNLRSLYLYKCSFPPMTCLRIPQLNHLVDLHIFACKDLVEIQGIAKLKSLTTLYIWNCPSFQRIECHVELNGLESYIECSFPTMACLHIPPQLNHLVDLNIEYCDNLIEIQGIGNLKSLTILTILFCKVLVEIQGIENLKSLTNLSILGCRSFQRIEGLVELNGLERISIWECQEFDGIDGVDRLLSSGTLAQLSIKGCKCKDVRYPPTTMDSADMFPRRGKFSGGDELSSS